MHHAEDRGLQVGNGNTGARVVGHSQLAQGPFVGDIGLGGMVDHVHNLMQFGLIVVHRQNLVPHPGQVQRQVAAESAQSENREVGFLVDHR